MLKRYVNSVIGVVAVLTLSFGARAQTAPSQQPAVARSQKAAPAPRRDLSGIWDVADRSRCCISTNGLGGLSGKTGENFPRTPTRNGMDPRSGNGRTITRLS